MVKHKGLGRGLDAILPEGIVEEVLGESFKSGKLMEISLDKISPNPLQPREDFDQTGLKELAESIKAQGILQPILLAPEKDRYVIIAGERRWRASQIAGLDKIPAIVLHSKPSDQKLLFLALVENLQRENLDPIEEALAYRMLADKFGLKQEEIAEKVGKSRPSVANSMRILKLPEPIIELLKQKQITSGHAKELLEEKDINRQIRLANLAARRGLSVERLSILVMNKTEQKRRTKSSRKTAEMLALEEELTFLLGTRVSIEKGKKKGKIVIEFFTIEDLDDIIGRLGGKVS